MFKKILSLVVLCLLVVNTKAQNNVLLIIADDLGVDYMPSYQLGSDFAPMPVLDSLADNGIQFNNTWTNPICSPSRANILTGKYAFRTGVGTAITGPSAAQLDTAEYTIAKAIKAQTNASTAMIGKWHLGHYKQALKQNPNACGFDYYAGNVEGALNNYFFYTKTVNGNDQNVTNQYATTVQVNDAINWIGNQTNNWFVTLSLNAPHDPYHKPPNNLHSFDNLSTNPFQIALNPIPYFKAMLESMDTEIGRLLSYLSSTNQLENTDIIFIGDNGTQDAVVQSPFISTKAKTTLYNGGVQVPLIISGPSVANPGTIADELVNSTDLFPTILEIMGGTTASLPADAAVDAQTILSILQGANDSQNARPYLYGDLFRPNTGNKDGKAISNGIFKLIEFDKGNTEFYNIEQDFFETNPLSINNLNVIQQENYDFLCGELSTLLDTNFCEISVGLKNELTQEFNVYPNPVQEQIRLSLFDIVKGKTSTRALLIDEKGSVVLQIEIINAEFSINVSRFAKGKYEILIQEENKTIATSSFIKM